MTVESLMNTFTQYVSWLYSRREWARWELLTIASTVMVLLLFILVQRRRAKTKRTTAKQIEKKPSTIGTKLDADQEFEGDSQSRTIVSVSKNNGNHKRWKETSKKWKNLQKLIEQLQQETAKYKQAEECLVQQFARLKEANERLGKVIAGSDQIIEEPKPEPETSSPRTIRSFGKQQNRILDPSGSLAEDS